MPYADLAQKRQADRDYSNANRGARAERAKAWREVNPDRQRAHSRRHHLSRKFGMSLDDYDALLASQDGRCAICSTEDTAPWDWFCVDHDHVTGAVRGLLCHACNVCIGQANDDTDRLRAAIEYLEARS